MSESQAKPLRNRSAEKREISISALESGGPGRVRTDDLFHAMEARSQLRHRPTRAMHFHYITPVSLPWSRRSEIATEPTQDGVKSRPESNQNGSPTSLEPSL